MVKETQLDTHEIDKLLADDDFIDDFDFSEDISDQLVDTESHIDDESEDESEDDLNDDFEFELDEPESEDPEIEELSDVDGAGDTDGGAAVVASQDELADVALDFDNLDFSITAGSKGLSRGLKMALGVAVFLWVLELSGVIYLLKQPVVIRDEKRPLAAEIDLSQPPPLISETVTEKDAEVLVAGDPDKPEIFLFTIYIPLYSLEGLKVFSAEVEVVQFQEGRRLVGDGQKQLQESLRSLLQEEVGGRLREEIVDVKSHLSGMIVSHIEKFFNERQVDLSKVKIRIHNPYVQ